MKIELIDNTFLDLPFFLIGVVMFLILVQNLDNYSSDSTRTSTTTLDLLNNVDHKLDIILKSIRDGHNTNSTDTG